MKVYYYYTLMSPWAYLGSERFYLLKNKYDFNIIHCPLDHTTLFSLSGGLPLSKRAEQRKVYRLMELKRWKEILNLPIKIEPKNFPPSDIIIPSCMILTLNEEEDQNKLTHKLLEAIWVEDKDIGNHKILEKICIECNLDFQNLIKKQKNMLEKFKNMAPLAAKNNIFGSPTYVINDEIFWGQDRLELFERTLKKLQK